MRLEFIRIVQKMVLRLLTKYDYYFTYDETSSFYV